MSFLCCCFEQPFDPLSFLNELSFIRYQFSGSVKLAILKISLIRCAVHEGQDPVAVGLIFLVLSFKFPAVLELENPDTGSNPVLKCSLEDIAIRVSLFCSSGQFSEIIFSGNDNTLFEVIRSIAMSLARPKKSKES